LNILSSLVAVGVAEGQAVVLLALVAPVAILQRRAILFRLVLLTRLPLVPVAQEASTFKTARPEAIASLIQ